MVSLRHFSANAAFYSSMLLLLLSVKVIASNSENDLSEIENFGVNPGNLRMFIHAAELPNDTAAMPLVVVLHGCSQDAKAVAELSGWNKLADLNGFMVLYPQQRTLNNPNTCFNWFVEHDIEKGQGECESVYNMIRFVQANYHINASRIFITGLSAGAAMSVVMAATHPELFNAAAVFAGGAYKIATNARELLVSMRGNTDVSAAGLIEAVITQNPAYLGKYPKMIVYQGMNDPIVNHRNADYIIYQWTGVNHTDTIPEWRQSAFMEMPDITRSVYQDSSSEDVCILYEVRNIGHRLLVNPGNAPDEGGKTGLFGVDRGFHSTFQTARDFGLIITKTD
ncbi:MAG: PHB depolymerase family esterase [Bacteroidetes bacterium]|nr:PHB depolymerase family esterase [Bacteroidota bacterium]